MLQLKEDVNLFKGDLICIQYNSELKIVVFIKQIKSKIYFTYINETCLNILKYQVYGGDSSTLHSLIQRKNTCKFVKIFYNQLNNEIKNIYLEIIKYL